jgi:hypothetical protein
MFERRMLVREGPKVIANIVSDENRLQQAIIVLVNYTKHNLIGIFKILSMN